MGPNGFHEVDTVLPLRSVIEANPKVFLFWYHEMVVGFRAKLEVWIGGVEWFCRWMFNSSFFCSPPGTNADGRHRSGGALRGSAPAANQITRRRRYTFEFYRVSHVYWVLLGSTGFCRVLLDFTCLNGVSMVVNGLYWVLLGFTCLNWVCMVVNRFYLVLLGFTGF